MLADAFFDENDEFAMKIKGKVDGKFLRMASIHVSPIEASDDPKQMLPRQTRVTLTKSKAREASIVDIGGNDEALRLSINGKMINLAEDYESLELSLLNNNEPETQTDTDMNDKELNLALGLKEDATADERKVQLASMKSELTGTKAQMHDLKEENVALKAKTEKLEKSANEAQTAELAKLITDMKLSAEQKTAIEKLAKQDLALAIETAKIMSPAVKLADVPGAEKPTADASLAAKIDGKTFEELMDLNDDTIYQLKASDPDKFEKMQAEYLEGEAAKKEQHQKDLAKRNGAV